MGSSASSKLLLKKSWQLLNKHQPISSDTRFMELRETLSSIGAQTLVAVLRKVMNNTVEFDLNLPWSSGKLNLSNKARSFSQNHIDATYAPLVSSKTTRIDFSKHDASTLCAIHRGMGHQVRNHPSINLYYQSLIFVLSSVLFMLGLTICTHPKCNSTVSALVMLHWLRIWKCQGKPFSVM
jgi:methionyl-tRNA formyltransferase